MVYVCIEEKHLYNKTKFSELNLYTPPYTKTIIIILSVITKIQFTARNLIRWQRLDWILHAL